MLDANKLRQAAYMCEELAIAHVYGTNPAISDHYTKMAAVLQAIAHVSDLADHEWDGLDEYYMHSNLNLMAGIKRGRQEAQRALTKPAEALADAILGGDQDV